MHGHLKYASLVYIVHCTWQWDRRWPEWGRCRRSQQEELCCSSFFDHTGNVHYPTLSWMWGLMSWATCYMQLNKLPEWRSWRPRRQSKCRKGEEIEKRLSLCRSRWVPHSLPGFKSDSGLQVVVNESTWHSVQASLLFWVRLWFGCAEKQALAGFWSKLLCTKLLLLILCCTWVAPKRAKNWTVVSVRLLVWLRGWV